MTKAQTPYRMTKIDEIRPYERNPRIIPQAAVDAVARSIQAFGFRQPIVVDGKGVILAGHTRYKAAMQLGLTEVPVVWQTDIDEIRAKGYRIADNKTAEISAWDRDQLDREVQDIAEKCDFDIKDLSLADWEIQRILAENEPYESIQPTPLHSSSNVTNVIETTKDPTTNENDPTTNENDTLRKYEPVKINCNSMTICYAEEDVPELAKLLKIQEKTLKKLKSTHFDRLKQLQEMGGTNE